MNIVTPPATKTSFAENDLRLLLARGAKIILQINAFQKKFSNQHRSAWKLPRAAAFKAGRVEAAPALGIFAPRQHNITDKIMFQEKTLRFQYRHAELFLNSISYGAVRLQWSLLTRLANIQ